MLRSYYSLPSREHIHTVEAPLERHDINPKKCVTPKLVISDSSNSLALRKTGSLRNSRFITPSKHLPNFTTKVSDKKCV